MSVQKFLVEADKLLEKGSIPEAIAKLKNALTADPSSQSACNKLADIYISAGQNLEAARLYGALAKTLGQNGKSQVAIVHYKKAITIAPQDIALKIAYAEACEEAGNLNEAYQILQKSLVYYLSRKFYSEALNVFPLLYRLNPREISVGALWLDTIIKSQAEHKVIHLIVALFGAPGIVSKEVAVGGDPLNLDPQVNARFYELQDWFPKDPKVPYSLAWASYRQQKKTDMYRFLQESIRRDPDFSLAYLLFARVLAEEKKFTESLFLYDFAREKSIVDTNIEESVKSQQIGHFAEQNPWMEESVYAESEELDASQFLAKFVVPRSPEVEKVAETLSAADISINSDSAAGIEVKDSSDLLLNIDGVQMEAQDHTIMARGLAPSAESEVSVLDIITGNSPEIELKQPTEAETIATNSSDLIIKPESVVEENKMQFSFTPLLPDSDENIDLGEDLLAGPTRMLLSGSNAEPTEHFINDLSTNDSVNVASSPGIEKLLKQSARYLQKQDFYLARKALQHALAIGADEEMIKNKLRVIRKEEFPDSLYANISNDSSSAEKTREIFHRIENEVDFNQFKSESLEEVQNIQQQIILNLEASLQETDGKTLLDLGIGFYEMGLMDCAEAVIVTAIRKYPDMSFNAYYLKALIRREKKDFAGAASILNFLAADRSKNDHEKISIYYALGEVLEKMDQIERSKAYFQKVSAIDIHYRSVKEKINR